MAGERPEDVPARMVAPTGAGAFFGSRGVFLSPHSKCLLRPGPPGIRPRATVRPGSGKLSALCPASAFGGTINCGPGATHLHRRRPCSIHCSVGPIFGTIGTPNTPTMARCIGGADVAARMTTEEAPVSPTPVRGPSPARRPTGPQRLCRIPWCVSGRCCSFPSRFRRRCGFPRFPGGRDSTRAGRR